MGKFLVFLVCVLPACVVLDFGGTDAGTVDSGMSGDGTCIQDFWLTVPSPGYYNVFAEWGASTGVFEYEIPHVMGETTKIVDQSANAYQWNDLGVYLMEAGSAQITVRGTTCDTTAVQLEAFNGPPVVLSEADWGTNGDIAELFNSLLEDDNVVSITIPYIPEKDIWLVGPNTVLGKQSFKTINVESGVTLQAKDQLFTSSVSCMFKLNVENWTFNGYGATIKMTDGYHIRYPNNFNRAGFELLGCKNFDIYGFQIEDMAGDGVTVAKKNDGLAYSENIKIIDVKVNSCDRNGISVTSGKNVLISGCLITNTFFVPDPDDAATTALWNGLDIETSPTGGRFENIVVESCKFENNGKEDLGVRALVVQPEVPISIDVFDCHFGNNKTGEAINLSFNEFAPGFLDVRNSLFDNPAYGVLRSRGTPLDFDFTLRDSVVVNFDPDYTWRKVFQVGTKLVPTPQGNVNIQDFAFIDFNDPDKTEDPEYYVLLTAENSGCDLQDVSVQGYRWNTNAEEHLDIRGGTQNVNVDTLNDMPLFVYPGDFGASGFLMKGLKGLRALYSYTPGLLNEVFHGDSGTVGGLGEDLLHPMNNIKVGSFDQNPGDDLLVWGPNINALYTYNQGSFVEQWSGIGAGGITSDNSTRVFGDFNGDGFEDFLEKAPDVSLYTKNTADSAFELAWTGPEGGLGTSWGSEFNSNVLVGKFNADLFDDVLVQTQGKLKVFFSTGATATFIEGSSMVASTAAKRVVADFTGDGLSDIVEMCGSPGRLLRNNGETGFTGSAVEVSCNRDVQSIAVGNFNQDSMADILIVDSDGHMALYYSTGSGFEAQWSGGSGEGGIPADDSTKHVFDFNNDGLQDVLTTSVSGTKVYLKNPCDPFFSLSASDACSVVECSANLPGWFLN